MRVRSFFADDLQWPVPAIDGFVWLLLTEL
jgi:hypothetical protein